MTSQWLAKAESNPASVTLAVLWPNHISTEWSKLGWSACCGTAGSKLTACHPPVSALVHSECTLFHWLRAVRLHARYERRKWRKRRRSRSHDRRARLSSCVWNLLGGNTLHHRGLGDLVYSTLHSLSQTELDFMTGNVIVMIADTNTRLWD